MLNAGDKIVLVGDSRWSKAFGSTDPKEVIDYKMQSLTPLRVLNYSAEGQRMSRLPTYEYIPSASFVDGKDGLLFPHGLFTDIKAVVIMLGINDWMFGDSQSLINFANAYRDAYRYLNQVLQCPIVFVSDLWTPTDEGIQNSGGLTINNFRVTTSNLATELGATFIDGKSLIPQDSQYFDNGSVHPNSAGHTQMATNLVNQLQTAGLFPAYV